MVYYHSKFIMKNTLGKPIIGQEEKDSMDGDAWSLLQKI